MEDFELVTLKSGISSLRSLSNLETFHPVTGPSIEAQVLHVDQQRLVERAKATEKFVIWDVGLGAAANALTAIQALQGHQCPVEIHSFDKTFRPLEFAIQNAEKLQYVLGYEKTLRSLIKENSVRISAHLIWKFHLGDFAKQLENQNLPAPHSIFYDPYSFTHNPEMWSLDHFEKLFRKLHSASPCLLTNYTRSTAVRISLLLAGFYVGIGCPVGEKAETTIASNTASLIEKPLDRKWLERVRVSRNAAPIRLVHGQVPTQEAISVVDLEHLQALPQFNG